MLVCHRSPLTPGIAAATKVALKSTVIRSHRLRESTGDATVLQSRRAGRKRRHPADRDQDLSGPRRLTAGVDAPPSVVQRYRTRFIYEVIISCRPIGRPYCTANYWTQDSPLFYCPFVVPACLTCLVASNVVLRCCSVIKEQTSWWVAGLAAAGNWAPSSTLRFVHVSYYQSSPARYKGRSLTISARKPWLVVTVALYMWSIYTPVNWGCIDT